MGNPCPIESKREAVVVLQSQKGRLQCQRKVRLEAEAETKIHCHSAPSPNQTRAFQKSAHRKKEHLVFVVRSPPPPRANKFPRRAHGRFGEPVAGPAIPGVDAAPGEAAQGEGDGSGVVLFGVEVPVGQGSL